MGDHFGGVTIFWSYASGFQVPWEEATSVFLIQIIPSSDTIHTLLREHAKMGLCYYPEHGFLGHIIPQKAGAPPAQHTQVQDSRQQSIPETCRFCTHTMGAM